MTTPELPPLPAYHFNLHRCEYRQIEPRHGDQPECYMIEDVEARERILLARIAELEADAKQARMMAWAIIRSAAGESWLTVPHHVVISMSDACAIERHDDDGGYQFRAIDAARKA